jgi:putative Holliday junction resolvase
VTLSRVLGLDPGERRIGVALSDPSGLIAQPYRVLDRRRGNAIEQITQICDEEGIETIVVGLPVSLSGEEGAAAVAARKLGSEVAEATGRNLVYWDERFTSVQAEQALLESGMRREKRRDTRDMVAAALMLQGYLDGAGARES